MAEPTPPTVEADPPQEQLEAGAYEIIRQRLRAHGVELRRRLEQLNGARKEVFGSVETKLLGTDRITTANNCTPRDIVAVGDLFLFGYNVHIGLRAETSLADVFAVYAFREGAFTELTLEMLDNEQFQRDFREVYRYYKDAVFAKFFVRGGFLYMVFRIGKSAGDIKTFKWLLQDGKLQYIDNRSDHEVKFPPQHEFEWKRATRDQHSYGVHPHVSIEDRVFVETVGGDLTVKVEDNTASGEGIYSEPVENLDQTLDDAEIHYAIVGNLVLLRIRPYQERQSRHLVFNAKLQRVTRIDSIADACVLLPEDQGLIFPHGYYLQTGEYKTFDNALSDLLFEKRVPALNGEDILYWFYNRLRGVHVLLQYNLIEHRVATPLVCNGAALFGGGELVCFKAEEAPQKHHALQIWQTPYVLTEIPTAGDPDSLLAKIGNRDLVRAMAECREVLQLIEKDDAYADLYVDLVKETTDLLDAYFWLGEAEACALREPLLEIRQTSASAIEEFEKVVRVRKATAQQVESTSEKVDKVFTQIKHQRFEGIDDFVLSLGDLRRLRGDVISLRELRYADLTVVATLESEIGDQSDRLAKRCVEFLLRPDALATYEQRAAGQRARVSEVAKVADARQLEEEAQSSASELEMLIDIVSNLKIDDATQRTTIIDRISTIFATINQARSALKARQRDLMAVEGAAEFGSQIKLLGQSVVNYLDLCDAPHKCDELLTKLMVQVEELEGRFAEFDEFVEQLVIKREEIYNAFEQRKLALVEARSKRAAALANAAERILKGISARVANLKTINEINGYFAADLMIDKVRDILAQLGELEDSVKVDDIQSRLKTIREDAVRQLKDRQDLFVDGTNIIKLGKHRFSVNVQTLDLTTVRRDNQICLHLTGTDFFEPLIDAALTQATDLWDQELVSESRAVSRAEYLAYHFVQESLARRIIPDPGGLRLLDEGQLVEQIQQFMGPRYSEGYIKGVHDHDAARIVRPLAEMHEAIGLLRFHPQARGAARVVWEHFVDPAAKEPMTRRLRGLGRLQQVFAEGSQLEPYVAEVRELLVAAAEKARMLTASNWHEGARYVVAELLHRDQLAVSRPAVELNEAFQQFLKREGKTEAFAGSLEQVAGDVRSRYLLARDWAEAFLATRHGKPSGQTARRGAGGTEPSASPLVGAETGSADGAGLTAGKDVASLGGSTLANDAVGSDPVDQSVGSESSQLRDTGGTVPGVGEGIASDSLEGDYLEELAGLLANAPAGMPLVLEGNPTLEVTGLVSEHPTLRDGRLRLNYPRFMRKLSHYAASDVPRYQRYVLRKKELVDAARDDLRLAEFRPRVLTSFVRNRLIDEVYLPLIGDNLAKQIGAAGDAKRTDLMGLLLLVSPPGYGKTTLMEYVANRLGVIFMKVNGPAIGHRVTSLDPAEAPNAAAREEIEKLNLAFEMGDNIMIYLDDIQHCHPELLQKFISLCDAQRKIEGVYKGRTRTYDFRGKKVIVVMAGNPYTESGEKFQIPDMLANRADIYNLGEIIGSTAEAFEISYLENALTSNPVLSKLAARSQRDVYAVIKIAATKSRDGVDFESSYAPEELDEMVRVMEKLARVRDIVLRVNREYIRSAAMADEYRIEPPFKLQGSYRNMNRIAERISPLMNDAELHTLILSSYENDAQTLTSDNEANMLKFKELLECLTPVEAERWEHIKAAYSRNARLKGVSSDDRFGQAVLQLSAFGEGLDAIRRTMAEGVAEFREAGATRLAAEAAASEVDEASDVGEDLSADRLAKILAALKAEMPPQEVLVQHKVPRVVLGVVSAQFELMQRWLQPLLEAGNQQSAEMQKLQASVEKCLANYGALIGELEAAGGKKGGPVQGGPVQGGPVQGGPVQGGPVQGDGPQTAARTQGAAQPLPPNSAPADGAPPEGQPKGRSPKRGGKKGK